MQLLASGEGYADEPQALLCDCPALFGELAFERQEKSPMTNEQMYLATTGCRPNAAAGRTT